MKIVTFWHMSLRQKNMLFISFFLCGIARAVIHLFSYKQISFYFGRKCHAMIAASTILSKDQIQKAMLIKSSIKLAARYTPWDSSCLTQAMVAKFWCQHYHIPYLFFIGFAKGKPLGQDAHAWLTAGPVAITGGHNLHTHQIVLSYSNYLERMGNILKANEI